MNTFLSEENVRHYTVLVRNSKTINSLVCGTHIRALKMA